MKKRVHVWVSGRVQGVFFRAGARDVARRHGLTGFARNLPDGRVEVVAEGEEEDLRALVEYCRRGPPAARVDAVEVVWEEPEGEFSGFAVL